MRAPKIEPNPYQKLRKFQLGKVRSAYNSGMSPCVSVLQKLVIECVVGRFCPLGNRKWQK